MRSSSRLTIKIVSGLLAVTLVCWLVGAGSRDCCAKSGTLSAVESAATDQHASAVEAKASEPNCAEPDHCRKAENAQRTTSFVSSCTAPSQMAGVMPCCSLLAQAFDGARKVRVVPERLAATSANVPSQTFFVSPGNGSLNAKSFVLNRGETYLRGCVFLI